MAKQQKETGQEQTQASHPDPRKDTLVLRYPQDGSVKVVSALSKQGSQLNMTTVEPLTKNAAAFYHITNSREVADFFTTMRLQTYMQGRDSRSMPELYRVPFDMVGKVGEALTMLQVDPQNEEVKKNVSQYRTSTTTLNKVLYDRPRMPLHELVAAGFDVDALDREGMISQMELGQETPLLPLYHKLADHISVEGLYSLRAVYDPDGDMHFKAQSPLPMPEFIRDEKLRMELNGEEMKALRAGKTLDRMLQHEGEYCYAALSRITNRMIYVRKKDVVVPDYLYNVRLNPAQQEELGRGGRAKLEECKFQNNDITFSGHAQFDVHRMDFLIADKHYQKIYIPEHIDRQLDTKMRQALYNFEMVDGRKLKTRDGRFMTCNLLVNKETKGLEYIDYKRAREFQEAAAKQAAQKEAPAAAPEYPVDAPTVQEPDFSQELPPEISEYTEARTMGRRM